MKRKSRKLCPALICAAAAVTAALFATGCVKVGPDYVQPVVPVPAQWSGTGDTPSTTEADPQALATWWTGLGDPILTDLVSRAVAGNLSLKQAMARVREVRSRGRVVAADLLPGFNLSGRGSSTYHQDGSGDWNSDESYSVGMDVAWEIDLFGGKRREVEAAAGDYQASLEDLRNVLVSLTAEVASAYVQMRTYEKRLEMARENLRLQMETLELTQIKYQTGLAGELNVQQAAYNLESTRALIPALEGGVEEMKNRLAVLLGEWPARVGALLAAPAPIPTASLDTEVGFPADLLRRRPDIRGAERRLAAQTARIGAAESDLYPKLNLDGTLGWQSLTLGSLISPAHFAAVVAGGLSWNVINTEAVRGNIEIQTALQEQALIAYESTLRTAVEEVQNALTALVKETRKQAALAKGVEAARQAVELALQEYENGISDFQNVLETQQSLRSLEDRLAESSGQATLDLITLYKALGGGWTAA